MHNANYGSQVEYGSTDLSQVAIAFRKHNGIGSARNVAVFEYETSKGLQTIARASQRGVGHAERIIAAELEAMGVARSSVRRIYSELEPCSNVGGYCKRFLANHFPSAQMTYSFEYGDLASRSRGVAALKRAVGRIFGG